MGTRWVSVGAGWCTALVRPKGRASFTAQGMPWHSIADAVAGFGMFAGSQSAQLLSSSPGGLDVDGPLAASSEANRVSGRVCTAEIAPYYRAA